MNSKRFEGAILVTGHSYLALPVPDKVNSFYGTVDPVAVCVGVRGGRIRRVVDALDGERIDLVRWHDDIKTLIVNSLQPAEIQAVVIDEGQRRATVFLEANQRTLLAGHRGINVALASDLVGYEFVVEAI